MSKRVSTPRATHRVFEWRRPARRPLRTLQRAGRGRFCDLTPHRRAHLLPCRGRAGEADVLRVRLWPWRGFVHLAVGSMETLRPAEAHFCAGKVATVAWAHDVGAQWVGEPGSL